MVGKCSGIGRGLGIAVDGGAAGGTGSSGGSGLAQVMAQAQVQAPVWLLEMEQTMPDPGQEAVYMIEVEVMLMAAMLLNG